MIYYTSDLHFGHYNVLRFDNRPFSTIEEMDNKLIELWNKRVTNEDTVYIVGDLCYRNKNGADWYLKQLNGHKILITGNHDSYTLKNQEAMKYIDKTYQILSISDKDRRVVMCHYPMTEWEGFYRNAYHVYGHIHNNKNMAFEIMKQFDRALNAGCMINNYMPVTLDELIVNNNKFKRKH